MTGSYPRQSVSWSAASEGEPSGPAITLGGMPVIVGRARVYWAPLGTRRPKPSSARSRTTSGRFRAGTRRNRRRERVRPPWPTRWRDLGPVDKIELTTGTGS